MFTFAKGFIYKFCFCLGLGTATYYSYGQVQKWVSHDQVKVVENVVEKHVTRENTVIDEQAPQEFSYEPVSAPVVAAGAEDAAAVAPPAVASTEEKKDEEKKDENAEKKDENAPTEEVAGGFVPQQGPATYAPQLASGPAPASIGSDSEKNYSPEIPLLPNAIPTPSSAGVTVSSGSSNGGGSIPTPGALDSNDIAALITPLKATFDDQMNKANGLLCVIGGHSCDRRNNVDVHSLRWSETEGLKKDVRFTIKSVGATALEFDFDFKIQNMGLVEESVVLSARPTDILVHAETHDSKNYRVIEFKFPELSVRGEAIKDVQATMVLEVTANGLVLSNESSLSFSRLKVDTLPTKWSPLAGEPTVTPIAIEHAELARRMPAQSGVFLIADELTFSMSVEKSQ